MYYVLKIKGTDKIPNFVQIRDEKMSLIAYFRLDQVKKGIERNKIKIDSEKLKIILEKINFGKIEKIEI